MTNTLPLDCIYHDTTPHVDTWPALVSETLCASMCEYVHVCVFCLEALTLKLHSSNVCRSPVSLYLNMETVTGSGSASLWQPDKRRDWLNREQNVSLQQQQEEPRSEAVNGAEDQREERRGEQPSLEQRHNLSHQGRRACVCVWRNMCVSVCINQSVSAFFSVYNCPINLNLSLGTFPQCKSNKSLYEAGECLCDLHKFCAYVCLCSVCV